MIIVKSAKMGAPRESQMLLTQLPAWFRHFHKRIRVLHTQSKQPTCVRKRTFLSRKRETWRPPTYTNKHNSTKYPQVSKSTTRGRQRGRRRNRPLRCEASTRMREWMCYRNHLVRRRGSAHDTSGRCPFHITKFSPGRSCWARESYSCPEYLMEISRTLVGNKIVDHSDVVGASPVGAAPTTSSIST